MKYPSDKENWKKFEQNNKEIALNILFLPHNKKEIETADTSKYNYKRKKQVILLMITDKNNRWHYLAVKSLPALFRGTTSSHNGDFYCLNCFHSYRTLNKLKKHERVCNNYDYCRIDMPEEHEKIKYLPGEKSLKSVYNFCRFRMSTKKTQYCQNNHKNAYTEKKAKHKTSRYTWCSICSIGDTKNKRYFYRGKDCIEKFCKGLKELGTEMINFKKKEMIPLTNKEIKSYEKQEVCYICEKKFCDDKNKKSEYDLYHKVRDRCQYTGKFKL